jgi:hypothetical protein
MMQMTKLKASNLYTGVLYCFANIQIDVSLLNLASVVRLIICELMSRLGLISNLKFNANLRIIHVKFCGD